LPAGRESGPPSARRRSRSTSHDAGGAFAGAEAFLGAATMVVDEVRLIKVLDPVVDLQ
jgi:hypothetical protein